MIDLVVRAPGLETMRERLGDVRRQLIDLHWLADRLAEILLESNRDARLAGFDRDGYPLAELSPETIKRRRRAGKGQGPPLLPDGDGSTLIDQAKVTVSEIGPGHYRITLRWDGSPWLSFHAQGGPHLPVRDIVGLTPGGREQVEEAVRLAVRQIRDELRS